MKYSLTIIFIAISFILKAQCLDGNCENGKGTWKDPQGFTYKGEFINREISGIGIINYNNELNKGLYTKEEAKAIIYYNGAKTYEGKLKDGIFNGKGKLTFYDGVIIEADWLDGNPTGIGSYIEPNSNSESNDGFTMTGPYIDGKITGQGKIEYNTKDVYIGSIKNSSRDGEGTLYYYAGGIKTGKWENGKCINCQSALSTTINLIKLKKEDGVYKIDVFINGIPVNNMIFDTGAGEISISPSFLLAAIENGDLDKSDILEGGNYINADGEINYNARVNLREVKIGNNTIQNIEASICKSCSGKGINLFGLNAIKKLGNSISIDFDKNELRYW